MYKVDKRKCIILLLCMNVIGYVVCSPVLDKDLDPNRTVVLIEKELRALEKDLNGNGEYVPEEDMLLLRVKVRKRLKDLTYNNLCSNPMLVRAVIEDTMATLVEKRAQQHASAITPNRQTITNAARIERNEFISLMHKYPQREGKKMRHYFGSIFETRVKDNVGNGKYWY